MHDGNAKACAAALQRGPSRYSHPGATGIAARGAFTEAAAMDPRITLLTLGVDDLERALAFYRDGLWPPIQDSRLSAERKAVRHE